MCPTGYSEVMYINRLEEEISYLKKEIKKYKKLSLIDTLTGLWNERKLKEDLKRYSELQERTKVKFTVALIDINNFKKYNDTYGHSHGNKILKKTSKIMKNSIRKYENVYRLGSGADEFVIIFSHSRKINKVIKRIKQELLEYNIYVSIGYNKLRKNVLKIIDKKMYKEKFDKVKKI